MTELLRGHIAENAAFWQVVIAGKGWLGSRFSPFLTAWRGCVKSVRNYDRETSRSKRLDSVAPPLSHLDENGKARMVDVTLKEPTLREAVAQGKVIMNPKTAALISEGSIPKGDVLGVARIAGVMAAKRTGDLIPLCHPLELTAIDVQFVIDRNRGEISIEARVRTVGRTGVEMEALTAVAVTALTVYDMCKSEDKGMVLGDIMLVSKQGGKSGSFMRGERFSSDTEKAISG
jgi:cyclic pyranopterin phosphate synthase